MKELFDLIIANKGIAITVTISLLGLLAGLWRLILYDKKSRLDFKVSKNKQANFSIYLEDSYRLNVENGKTYLLFNVKITNHSTAKNSLNATAEISYSDYTLIQKHQNELFAEIPHQNLTQLPSNINLDEKEIKSGWLIFNYPKKMKNILINQFKIIVKDSNGVFAEVTSVLIKDIMYED